jgi:hypothetical protein
MLRGLLTGVGLVELLAPDALVGTAERLALENPAECERRAWVGPVARLEGLLVLASVWRSDGSYAALKRFLGVVGVLALLSPRTYVDYGGDLAYVDDPAPEWRPWVYPATRLVGLLYVLVAVDELLSD